MINGKKWFLLFVAALLLVMICWALINYLVDPFGVFGDSLMHWDAYSQTLNPRIGKLNYLQQHWDDYDAYIIGSSSAASYLPQTLNGYLDADFYNMFHYGADIRYDAELVRYLLAHDDVKHIVLVLGLSEANAPGGDTSLTSDSIPAITGRSEAAYYGGYLFAPLSYAAEKLSSRGRDTELPQPFDVFVPADGTYDKRVRDVEPIGSLEEYLAAQPDSFPAAEPGAVFQNVELCADRVAEIRRMCREAGTELTVILTPVCLSQLDRYADAELERYFNALAQTGPCWNFAVSSLSWDARYFYDRTHTRNATANMVLAEIFSDEHTYRPADLGGLYTADTPYRAGELRSRAEEAFRSRRAVRLPVLLYHHLTAEDEGEESDTQLCADRFERQMELLEQHGYQPVSLQAVLDHVELGTPLPEKAVLITFDDGYLSNYVYAFPVLKRLGFPATIFTIGCSIGHDRYYKDTQFELTPHFGQAEIDEMLGSGLISIQSHTYDMHQWPDFETVEPVRKNILPLEGEAETAYIAALSADIAAQDTVFAAYGIPKSDVLAFPGGMHETIADVVLREHGFRATMTIDKTRINELTCGLPQCLVDLGRLTITGETTDEMILSYLEMNGTG